MNMFDKVKEKMDNSLLKRPTPHRVILMVMMNEIPLFAQGPKGSSTKFLQDAARNAVYFGKFKPGYFMSVGPGSEKLGILKSTPKT